MSGLLTVQRTTFKVSDFISWFKKGNIILSPKFQRRSVWSKGAKSYLIDTVHKGFPIPIIFLRDMGTDPKTFEPKREVIDGQQRLRTLIAFINPELLKEINDFDSNRDDFTVSKTHNEIIADKKFQDLEEEDQQQILNYEFSVNIVPRTIGDSDITQIFRRMNSTNFTLKPQELRNAEYYGEFKMSQYELAAEQNNRWREWGIFTEDNLSRMEEVQLISEISITILEQKANGRISPPKVIDSYYAKYDDRYPNRTIVEERIRKTLDFIHENFKGNKSTFIFFKKTLFFTFFFTCYELLYGLSLSPSSKKHPKKISNDTLNLLKRKIERVANDAAPEKILEAANSRRATNATNMKTLLKYLKPNA